MSRSLIRRTLILVGVFALAFVNIPSSRADSSLFLFLKQFFQKQLGPVNLQISPVAQRFPEITAEQKIKWDERIQIRNQWRDQYVVNHKFLDSILVPFNGGDDSSVISVSAGDEGLDPTNPDVAYNPTNQRYFVVW